MRLFGWFHTTPAACILTRRHPDAFQLDKAVEYPGGVYGNVQVVTFELCPRCGRWWIIADGR